MIFGTRPEGIKLCPLVRALREDARFAPHVCVTGQHREMLVPILEVFGVMPDVDLGLMTPNQTLAEFSSRCMVAIDSYLDKVRPDFVIVQGDTTTAFVGALAAYYRKVPVGHVEAGLRSGSKYSPFPEEVNRILVTHIAEMHFAPTALARLNLLAEGVPDKKIVVTGNTVIDALNFAVRQLSVTAAHVPGLQSKVMEAATDARMVLITGHRRENFGEGFREICRGIARLARDFSEVQFVYPVHLNPNVRGPVVESLGLLGNVHLIDPVGYLPFVTLMARCSFILTDSGGVQEEAPSLGKPVLVMRDTTERPEGVEAGNVRLVGANADEIYRMGRVLLTDPAAYQTMALSRNPYGDGTACRRIIDALI